MVLRGDYRTTSAFHRKTEGPNVTEPTNNDGGWPGDSEDDRSLADAYARVHEAVSDFKKLESEVTTFHRRTVAKMAKGWSNERNSFVISLPPAKLAHKGKVTSRIRLLCGRVSEHLRAALDYAIVRVSRENNSELVERDVKFILAKNDVSFGHQAKRALKYVNADVKNWVERLQPYHGNEVLAFIRDTSNIAKHRSLVKIKHATSLTIVLHDNQDTTKFLDESEWWKIPAGEGHTYLARADRSQLIVRNRFDALTVLPICIEHVHMILNSLECYLQNRHFP